MLNSSRAILWSVERNLHAHAQVDGDCCPSHAQWAARVCVAMQGRYPIGLACVDRLPEMPRDRWRFGTGGAVDRNTCGVENLSPVDIRPMQSIYPGIDEATAAVLRDYRGARSVIEFSRARPCSFGCHAQDV